VLQSDRAQLFNAVDLIIRHSNAAFEERNSDQENLFGAAETSDQSSIRLPVVPVWSALEKLSNEFEAVGFYLSAHPLDSYGSALERVGVVNSAIIAPTITLKNGSSRINLAGIVSSCRLRTNQRGNKYAFVQLSDQTGVFEVTIFSEVLAESTDFLQAGTAVLIRCDAKNEDGNIRLLASRVQCLDVAMAQAAKGLKIYLKDSEIVATLAKVLSEHGPGKGHVKVTVQTAAQEIELVLPNSYLINASMRSAVKSLPGVIDVRDI
jgi:DNA polymerase-3 subunit alpha